MICTDAYSDQEYEEMVVYGDQGITSRKFDENTYGELMNTDSDEEQIIKYNVALYTQDSVSLEKKQRWLNRDIPIEDKNQLSLSHNEINRRMQLTRKMILYEAQQAMMTKSICGKHGPWGCQGSTVISQRWKKRSWNKLKTITRSSYMLEQCMQIT